MCGGDGGSAARYLQDASAARSAAAVPAGDVEGSTPTAAKSHHWRVRVLRNTLKHSTASGRDVTCSVGPPATGTECTWPLEEQ